MQELWQLYTQQGLPIEDAGADKKTVFSQGLLHGAAHVWMWRKQGQTAEVLLQKRAPHKATWPNCYDISAAGHIDLHETPLAAALREAKEEINLDITPDRLNLFGVHRAHMVAPNGAIENEFQWLYLLELSGNQDFTLQATEVAATEWIPLEKFKQDCTSDRYVSHSKLYYDTVTQSIEAASAPNGQQTVV